MMKRNKKFKMIMIVLAVVCGIGQCVAAYGINVNDGSRVHGQIQRYKRQDTVTCEDGWVNNERSCYFYSTEETTWDDGMAKCVERGSKLVEINDASENQFVTGQKGNFGHVKSFIGATDADEEGTWVGSISGQPVSYSNWDQGQPNNHGDDQDCAVLSGGVLWDDDHCGGPYKYICEKTVTCDEGWLNFGRSCYLFSSVDRNWNDGMQLCRQDGGYLVEINDANENDYLASKQVQFGFVNSYIGASDASIEGTWIWANSEQAVSYSNWDSGQPDGQESQNYGVLYYNGRWDDGDGGAVTKIICEKSGSNCDPNPCNNNGSCTDQDNGYICTCANGYSGINCDTATLSVESCTTFGVEYTVYSGQANGVTYIGGTTSDSSECIKTLAGTASESFLLNFGTCGVDLDLDSSTNSIEVRVIVQHKADVRTGNDLIYTLTCTFGEHEDIVVTAETWGNENDDTNEVAVEIIPLPVMTLYRVEDPSTATYVQMSDTTVVVLGTALRQKIELDKNVPNYKLSVQTCSMEARRMPEDVLLRELVLLDNETSCSRLGVDIYPEFTYLTDDVIVNGNQFDVPYVMNEFEAFIPSIPNIDLAGSSVKLVISCRCSVCFGNNNACDPPTCGNNRRRRRAVEDNPGVKNYDNLIGSFQIQIGNKTVGGSETTIKGPDGLSTETGFVGSVKFWAILISAVVVVVIVAVSLTGVFLHMKKAKGHSGHHADRRPSKRNMNDFSNGGWSDRYPPEYMPRSGPPMHARHYQHHYY